MKLYLRLIKYLRPHWVRLVLASLCAVVVSLLTAAYAWLVRPVLDDVFIQKDARMLVVIPIAIFLVSFSKGVFHYVEAYLIRYVGNCVITEIRSKLYRHVMLLPIGFHEKNATGRLMSHIITDVGLMQTAVSSVVKDLFQQSLTLVALTGVIFYQNWQLATVAVMVLPIAYYPMIRLGRRLRKISHSGQEKIGDLTSVLQETLAGVRTVKAFGREEFESQRFSEKNQHYFKNIMKATQVSEMTPPIMEAIGSIGVAAIVAYGGYQVISGVTTPGTFFSFMAAALMMYTPVRGLSGVNNVLQQALAAMDRVFVTLDEINERESDSGRKILPPVKGWIEFRDVSFRYESGDRPALLGVNLSVKPGEVVALVGSSGSGKTTLANLIPRFYEASSGTILIDGTDIREVTLASLRSQIGIVSQEIVLFDDTVRRNIAYGMEEVDEEKIIAAAKAAYADPFIVKMPQGYDTQIGSSGCKLSGGERQRLA
ncbi:MAG TPA: ABC transporter transmembrane domain-containing protein, partial [Nitrospiria bacterium]|nr:ABC transporter transmembrane domain-containing protein [Nitrospiria bacterium]